jgi:hypothetical protein
LNRQVEDTRSQYCSVRSSNGGYGTAAKRRRADDFNIEFDI